MRPFSRMSAMLLIGELLENIADPFARAGAIARNRNRGINCDAIFVIEPIEQFFGAERRIEQFMVLDSVEKGARLYPIIMFGDELLHCPRARRPMKAAWG